ncbi:MAG: phosphatidylglycerol lysyltransferase domain-containing protein [Calditerrivibrio sp.]|nr:phosphatidylglycerol lysyltransferase domain-containing protein [Calditerrivibrio sp.]MCA1931972.1 phosphatidylglycerol lysyltransferase domain-containing protein [Calditerrivibrio sp.]
MKSEALDLKHKELLFKKLKNIDTRISEYSFANLYLFRRNHKYEVCYGEDILIKGVTYDGKKYYMPTFDFNLLSTKEIDRLLEDIDFIFPLEYEWVKKYEDKYIITSNLDDTDYIFTLDKMTTFKGRNLHGKRNLLKQFTENYKAEIKPLVEDTKDDAIYILEQWQISIGESVADTDYLANMDAIKYSEELVICGIIYYVEDKPVGFIMGEEINNDTFVIHFAKGIKDYKGVYQYIYNSFANMLPKRYTYLNFEQDLGKPSLRLAKSSYEPDILLHKYRLSLR